MSSINQTVKPGKPPLQSLRLLDKVRERIRYLHYSIRTEDSYAYWIRYFVRWHGLRHPAAMGGPEVERFLSYLANERGLSASTHKHGVWGQALPFSRTATFRSGRRPNYLLDDLIFERNISSSISLRPNLSSKTGLCGKDAVNIP